MQRGTKNENWSGPGEGEARPRGGRPRPGARRSTRASSVTNEVWLSDEFAVRVNRRPDAALARGATRPAPARRGPLPRGRRLRHGIGLRLARDPAQRRQCPQPVLADDVAIAAATRRRAGRLHAPGAARHHDARKARHEHDGDAPQLLNFRHDASPVAPLLDALERAARLPNVDPDVMYDLAALVATSRADHRAVRRAHVDPRRPHVRERAVGRRRDHGAHRLRVGPPAPRDLELDVLLRFCAYPVLHVADDYEAHIRAEAYEEVPSWLAEDYPQLFAAPNLRDRLRVYAIAFEVRRLLMLPPSAPCASCQPAILSSASCNCSTRHAATSTGLRELHGPQSAAGVELLPG